LINGCGIEEAIGNHAHAAFERGLDYLAHQLAATSLKEEQLGPPSNYAEQITKVPDSFPIRKRRVRASEKECHIAEDAPSHNGLCGLSCTC
jgi:hypothetical protein